MRTAVKYASAVPHAGLEMVSLSIIKDLQEESPSAIYVAVSTIRGSGKSGNR